MTMPFVPRPESPRSPSLRQRVAVVAARSPLHVVLLAGVPVALFFATYEVVERTFLIRYLPAEALNALHLLRGFSAAFVAAAFVLWAVGVRDAPRADAPPRLPVILDRDQRMRTHLTWFVELRWLAATAALILTVLAIPLARLLPERSLWVLLAWWSVLVCANLVFGKTVVTTANLERHAMLQIATDMAVLTGLLNASGGVENPLAIAYVFQIVIAAIILPKRRVMQVSTVATLFFLALSFGELFRIFPHVTNLLFPHHGDLGTGHASIGVFHAAHDPLFVAGRAVPFVAVFFLTGYFVTLVAERLRSSENELERVATTALLERQRLEGLIDAAGVGTLVVREDLFVEWSNPRARDWVPLADERVKHVHDSEDACPACLVTQTYSGGTSVERERVVHDGGRPARAFRFATFPIRNRERAVVQVVELVEDITARKALEAEALHAGKLAILGQMATGVAHEVGNPLSSLDTRLRLMLHRRNDPDFFEESIGVLREQIDRMRRIVRGVSRFARGDGDQWTMCDLSGVAEDAMRLVAMDDRAPAIAFCTAFANDLPSVRGIRDQLLQVVVNLLINAMEAMPEGGNAAIRTSFEGASVALSIEDEGGGFDAVVRERLFQPFVTTKQNGTGLGLSICHTLVHAHGGTIEVNSTGHGTRVVVRLPVASQERAA